MKFIKDAIKMRLNGYGVSIYKYKNADRKRHSIEGKVVLVPDRYGRMLPSSDNRLIFATLDDADSYINNLPGINDASKLEALLIRLRVFNEPDTEKGSFVDFYINSGYLG